MSDSVFRGYLSVFAGDFGRLATFAVFIPLLVRVISPTQYGQYALVMAVFIPLRKFLNFGLFDATKTYGSRSDVDSTRVFVTSFWLHVLLLVGGVGVSAVVITTSPLSATLRHSLFFVLLAVAGNQFYNYGRGVLHALKRESLAEPLIPARSVILAVVGLWLAATGYGVTGVFVGFAVGFLCAGAVTTGLAFRESGILPIPERDVISEYGGDMLRFGAPSMLLILLTVGLYKIDILLVTHFLTGAKTGYYRAALQVAEFIWVVSVAMEMVMIQTTSALWEQDARERISSVMAELLRYVVILSALLIVGVFVLGPDFVRLYFGPDYDRSVRALRILLPGVFGFAVARVVWPVLQAGGYLRGVVAATGVATLANLLLNLLLIPRFGIVGAAAATSVSYGGMAVTHTLVARRVGLQPLAGLPVLRIGGATGLTGVVLFALRPLTSPLLSLVVLPPVGLAVYAACLFGTGVLSVSEVRTRIRDGIEGT